MLSKPETDFEYVDASLSARELRTIRRAIAELEEELRVEGLALLELQVAIERAAGQRLRREGERSSLALVGPLPDEEGAAPESHADSSPPSVGPEGPLH